MLKIHNHYLITGLIWAFIISMGVTPTYAQDTDIETPNTFENNPLLSEPETPSETLNAVVLLNKLGRSDLAKKYLEQLLATDPDDDVILELRDEHGPALFLSLSRNQALHPESKQLLDRVNASFRKQALDSGRVSVLINDLTSSGSKSQIALTAITDLGAPVVPALLREFAATVDDSTRNSILYAIVQIGEPAIPVLVGGVMSPSDQIKDASIICLGWMNDASVVSYLWYPAFGPDVPSGRQASARLAVKRILKVKGEAVVSPSNLAGELTRLTQLHLNNDYAWELDPDSKLVALWQWDSSVETLVKKEYEPVVASLIVGSHFSGQALALAPQNRSTQATYLALALAKEYQKVGWNADLPTGPGTVYNLALTSGSDVLTEALSISMENANLYSILASLQALGQVASSQQLALSDAKQASLIAALNYPSSRVQFAAATTILQIDPDKKFKGNDRIISILSSAMNDTQTKRAVVIDPDEKRGARMLERLGDRGYETEHVRTGREGFSLAADRMDVKLIAIHINAIRWGLSQTLSNFRADARTASLPIVIYGPANQEYKLLETMDRTPLTVFIPEQIDPVLFTQKIQDFLASVDTPDLSPELRRTQVETAAYWLSFLSVTRRSEIYDLAPAEKALTGGLDDPALAEDCLMALSSIPNKSSQRTLFSAALLNQNSSEIRQIAAHQLAYHIQRFGWLLNETNADDLHQAHDNSDDPELATALASVIGSLKPNSQLVGERLRSFDNSNQ
ncbi:MAG: hypothetical protein HUJ26_00245 [Planctomycetaceae bacterium]|nr:hypothetical protein [Planctomycetaceae bacterium]